MLLRLCMELCILPKRNLPISRVWITFTKLNNNCYIKDMENKKITGDWDGEKIWQHAKPVEDKRTLSEIKEEMMDIQGKWNGDDAGVDEDNANTAEDILEAVKNLEELLTEIN